MIHSYFLYLYQCCLFAIINPSLSGKVGRLSTVESMIETSMIAKWERDNELPSLLGDLNRRTTHNLRANIRSKNFPKLFSLLFFFKSFITILGKGIMKHKPTNKYKNKK